MNLNSIQSTPSLMTTLTPSPFHSLIPLYTLDLTTKIASPSHISNRAVIQILNSFLLPVNLTGHSPASSQSSLFLCSLWDSVFSKFHFLFWICIILIRIHCSAVWELEDESIWVRTLPNIWNCEAKTRSTDSYFLLNHIAWKISIHHYLTLLRTRVLVWILCK